MFSSGWFGVIYRGLDDGFGLFIGVNMMFLGVSSGSIGVDLDLMFQRV